MAPIASSIASREHSAPLQYTDVNDIREECRGGFEQQTDDSMWTIPDLRSVRWNVALDPSGNLIELFQPATTA